MRSAEKQSNLLAFLFGIFGIFVMITGAEGVLYLLNPDNSSCKVVYPEGYHKKYDFGVKRAGAGKNRVYSVNGTTGQTIYDVVYTIDEYGRILNCTLYNGFSAATTIINGSRAFYPYAFINSIINGTVNGLDSGSPLNLYVDQTTENNSSYSLNNATKTIVSSSS